MDTPPQAKMQHVAKKVFDRFANKLKNLQASTQTLRVIFWIIILILLIGVISYIIGKVNLNNKNCSNLSKIYDDFPKISSINPDDAQFQYKLRDYYIKTAYNCCCAGQFKNDFVNICALKNAIKQGARCLDFEIYSVDNKPVIATSSVDNFSVKEMYNSVPFSDAMNVIANYAYSNSTCPNANDPLILHFRIMSKNKDIYKMMADDIFNNLETRLLDKKYSYEYDGQNLGTVPIKEFLGKTIIIADKTNGLFESTPLDEYINIASNSIFMRALRNYDVVYTPDMQELIDFNKKNMTITMPDLSPYDTNDSASLHMKYGCQMVGMCFQNYDSKMEYYDVFFDGEGHAFVLKPANLRYVPVTVPDPTPQKPAYSYAPRAVKSDYYSFSI
jgi:hypothetical protein